MTTDLFGDDYFETVASAVAEAGLVGSLVHTGGGVMVYHVNGRDGVSVGIDRESVVGYVDDEEVSDTISWIPDGATMADIIGMVRTTLLTTEQNHA